MALVQLVTTSKLLDPSYTHIKGIITTEGYCTGTLQMWTYWTVDNVNSYVIPRNLKGRSQKQEV